MAQSALRVAGCLQSRRDGSDLEVLQLAAAIISAKVGVEASRMKQFPRNGGTTHEFKH
jgi:hypothetical protein